MLTIRYILAAILCLTPVFPQNRPVLENARVRVVAARNSPGQKSRMHKHDVNRVMVHLGEGHMILAYEDGRVNPVRWKNGDVRWDPAGGMHTSENAGPGSYAIIEVELKQDGSGAKALPAVPAGWRTVIDNDQVRVLRLKGRPSGAASYDRLAVRFTEKDAVTWIPAGAVPSLEEHDDLVVIEFK